MILGSKRLDVNKVIALRKILLMPMLCPSDDKDTGFISLLKRKKDVSFSGVNGRRGTL